mmetsp:Transcript_25978/g.60051  ORF Transcript_25978/g.60051 Transcript_25978/m.60051 type:complete len:302 (-) Transcript_25978:24-929(-)
MNDTSSDEDGVGYEAVMGFHLVVFILVSYGVRRYCCNRAAAGNARFCSLVKQEEVQARKSQRTTYALFFLGGLLGIHHYYLDRPLHGILATWTLNFCGIGAIVDIFKIPKYVDNFNEKRTPPLEPTAAATYRPSPDLLDDKSSRKVLIHFPLVLLLTLGILVPTIIHGPAALQRFGIVDIDRLAAQTEKNPYDILELDGGATLAEAKAAYRKQSLKWHPDRNAGCGKECDDKMAEITKAFDLIKKKKGVAPDRTMKGWLKSLALDWMNVFVAAFTDDPSSFADPFNWESSESSPPDDEKEL